MIDIPDAPYIRQAEKRGTDYTTEWWQMKNDNEETDETDATLPQEE